MTYPVTAEIYRGQESRVSSILDDRRGRTIESASNRGRAPFMTVRMRSERDGHWINLRYTAGILGEIVMPIVVVVAVRFRLAGERQHRECPCLGSVLSLARSELPLRLPQEGTRGASSTRSGLLR